MKSIPFRVRLTVESGTVCCFFNEFHRWAEKLVGYKIWTHEFGIPEVLLELKMALLIHDHGYDYHGERMVDPVATLMRLRDDVPVIAVSGGMR